MTIKLFMNINNISILFIFPILFFKLFKFFFIYKLIIIASSTAFFQNSYSFIRSVVELMLLLLIIALVKIHFFILNAYLFIYFFFIISILAVFCLFTYLYVGDAGLRIVVCLLYLLASLLLH